LPILCSSGELRGVGWAHYGGNFVMTYVLIKSKPVEGGRRSKNSSNGLPNNK